MTDAPSATTTNGERRVVEGFPPWLAALRFVDGQLQLVVRVPVPTLAQLEQLAWQRDQHEREQYFARMTINGAPASPPTFEIALVADAGQAAAITEGVETLLAAAAAHARVVDVEPERVIDIDG